MIFLSDHNRKEDKRDLLSVLNMAKKSDLNFIQLFQNVKKNLSRYLGFIKQKGYTPLESFFSKRENLNLLLDIGVKLLILFIICLMVWFFLQKLNRRWKERKRATLSLGGKINDLLFRFFSEFYPLVALFFLSWVFLKLTLPEAIASSIVYVVGIYLIYRLFKSLCSLIFFPPQSRLFQIDELLVHHIISWCHRILNLSLWVFVLARLSSLAGLEQFATGFFKIYKVVIVTMLAIILVQAKDSIQKRLSFPLIEDKSWKGRVKKIYNHLIGQLYLAVIVYCSAIVMADLLGYGQAARFFLYATLKSLLVIGLTAIVWFFWNRLFRRLMNLSKTRIQGYPQKVINQYVVWSGKIVHFMIILLAGLIFLAVWKVDIFTFIISHSSYIFLLVRIPALIVAAIFLSQLTAFLVRKMTNRITKTRIQAEETSYVEIEKQMSTIGGILRKTAIVFIWSVTGTMVLKELGFSIGPILAGAGIVGLAVGFGSQNLVRDIISGLFIIAENQIRVGDVAILNGTGGLVEAVNLRTTVLRGLDGTVHIFPNGTINTVSNMTHGFSYYLFNIGVAYKEDVDHVCAVLKQIGDQIIQEEPYNSMILEPLEIIGLDEFADSAVIIKARIKTQPIKQWQVGREMNRRIKKRFDQEGIEIPFPHQSLYFGEASKPIDINIKGWEESSGLKDFIRDTVRELKLEEQKNKKETTEIQRHREKNH